MAPVSLSGNIVETQRDVEDVVELIDESIQVMASATLIRHHLFTLEHTSVIDKLWSFFFVVLFSSSLYISHRNARLT